MGVILINAHKFNIMLIINQNAVGNGIQWLIGEELKVSKNKKELKKSHTVSPDEAERLILAGIAKEKSKE